MHAWKRKKQKVEKASREARTEYEHSPRAMQLREYTPKEFWEIFVDDRAFGADAIFRQVNVQSKAVVSCAITLMDKIRGWEDEGRWVGSKFAARMWIFTLEPLTGGQMLDWEREEYLKKPMMSIMFCTNWVWAGTFVDHEWVSSRTNVQQKDEVSSMVLDFKIDVPCVVQWSLLWFSAPTNLNRILGHELKIKKYHEVVNNVIVDAVVRPFGGEHTPRSYTLTSVARILHRTHKTWRVNKEMEGWMARGNLAPSSREDDEDESSDE